MTDPKEAMRRLGELGCRFTDASEERAIINAALSCCDALISDRDRLEGDYQSAVRLAELGDELLNECVAARDASEAKLTALVEALEELRAIVKGECPRLLDEDSGGNSLLALKIEALLSDQALAHHSTPVGEAVTDRATGSPIPGPHTAELISGGGLHHATAAMVNRFAYALAEKLRKAEVKYGYSDGWKSDDWEAECRTQLHQHADKGDPLDVAAYAAFCWSHGWSTAPPSTPTSAPVGESAPVKHTMTLNLTDEEMAALEKLSVDQGLRPPTVFRQALRVYQLYSLPEGHHDRIGRSPTYGADRLFPPAAAPVPAPVPAEEGGGLKTREPIEHELKCWTESYEAVESDIKPFEYRKADRDYRVGDTLWLREWNPCSHYTGKSLRRRVTWILNDGFGLAPGYCVMALSRPTQAQDVASLVEGDLEWLHLQKEWARSGDGVTDRQADTEQTARVIRILSALRASPISQGEQIAENAKCSDVAAEDVNANGPPVIWLQPLCMDTGGEGRLWMEDMGEECGCTPPCWPTKYVRAALSSSIQPQGEERS